MALSPIVYSYIQGYWALYTFSVLQFFSVYVSEYGIGLPIILLMSFVGDLMVALLLAMPLGYLINKQWFLFSSLLSIAPILLVLWSAVGLDGFDALYMYINIGGQVVGIFVAFVFMAKLGSYVRIRHHRKVT